MELLPRPAGGGWLGGIALRERARKQGALAGKIARNDFAAVPRALGGGGGDAEETKTPLCAAWFGQLLCARGAGSVQMCQEAARFGSQSEYGFRSCFYRGETVGRRSLPPPLAFISCGSLTFYVPWHSEWPFRLTGVQFFLNH